MKKDNEGIMDNDHNQHENSLINRLPDDCLIQIFSFLDISDKINIERVCKRWSQVSKLGWPEAAEKGLDIFYSDFTTRQLHLILRRCGRFLQKVHIFSGRDKIRRLKWVKKHCSNLESLEMSFNCGESRTESPFYFHVLSTLFSKVQKLKELSVDFANSDTVDDEFLENINENSLKSLQMTGLENRRKTRLTANICKFSKLHYLDLTDLIIGEESLRGFGDLINLAELDLAGCNVPLKCIDDIKNFKNLKSLNLTGVSEEITDHHVSAIVENCDRLRFLAISDLENLSDMSFDNISKLQNLNHLQMNTLPNITNRAVGKMLQVKSLHCNHCPGISNDGLINLIENSNHLGELSVIGTADMNIFLLDVNVAMTRRKNNGKLELILGNHPAGSFPSFPESLSPSLIIS